MTQTKQGSSKVDPKPKPGVTVVTDDGITVKITGSPSPITDNMLKGMFEQAMDEIKKIRRKSK